MQHPLPHPTCLSTTAPYHLLARLPLAPPIRSISFHARFGAYYKTRVPKFGRDLAYCPFSAELLVAASAPEVRCFAFTALVACTTLVACTALVAECISGVLLGGDIEGALQGGRGAAQPAAPFAPQTHAAGATAGEAYPDS